MRKQIILFIAVLMSTCMMAQVTPTKFLGIPVDGTKQAMIQKLQAKGFKYNSSLDCLRGDFNGRESDIVIVTNRNKVWRVMVIDKDGCSEGQIRIRYNRLLDQFLNNAKYRALSYDTDPLPEDEDISYEMTVHAKEYQVAFLQKAPDGEFYENNTIWFTISEYLGEYRIVIYYDNINNGANGEDL